MRFCGSGRRFSSWVWSCSGSITSVTCRPAGRGCTRRGSTKGWSSSLRSAASHALRSCALSDRRGSSSALRSWPPRSATSSTTSGSAAVRRSHPPPTAGTSLSIRSSTSGSCSCFGGACRPSARAFGSMGSSLPPRQVPSAHRCSSRSSSIPRTGAVWSSSRTWLIRSGTCSCSLSSSSCSR